MLYSYKTLSYMSPISYIYPLSYIPYMTIWLYKKSLKNEINQFSPGVATRDVL